MGTVHVVATPIGNLEDITLRALRVLREADLVFAEDTRRTRILLDRHGVEARPVSLNAHNEPARIEQALAALRRGASVALVSDAGTPLISDPGARLLAAAVADGHRAEAVPGASALLAALSVSGLRPQPFTFLGFLPRKAGARRRLLEPYRLRRETLVIFESPRRVGETLSELAEWLGGQRRACVARELTKLHEEVVRGTLSELAERFAEGGRGEFTLVVEGVEGGAAAQGAEPSPCAEPPSSQEIDREIHRLVQEGLRPREVASRLARGSGLPRREIYARALAARGASGTQGAADDTSAAGSGGTSAPRSGEGEGDGR